MIKWIDVVGFEGLYKVSDQGDVFSIERNGTKGGILKTSVDRYGYKKVVLYKDDKRHYFTVHRLVAIAFIPNPERKEQVNHKNSNRLDNSVGNLEWSTTKENIYHSHNAGNQTKPKQKILAINTENGENFVFDSQRDASLKLGLSQGSISRVVRGIYSELHGYKFKRIEG